MMKESCGKCIYLVVVGDPKEPINECHRFPPMASGKAMAVYPLVKNDAPGCGEGSTGEELAELEKEPTSAALPTKVKERIDKARSNRLKR